MKKRFHYMADKQKPTAIETTVNRFQELTTLQAECVVVADVVVVCHHNKHSSIEI
jgi:hypothetical protein